MQTIRSIAILGAVFAGVTGFAAISPASANVASNAGVPRTRVVFGDLDLATPAGRKTLAHRVDNALEEVCPNNADTMLSAVAACRAEAAERARADLQKAGVSVL